MKANTALVRNRLFWGPLLIWTLVLGLNYLWHLHNEAGESLNSAKYQAQANLEKDQVLRTWASRHGGVYVDQSTLTQSASSLADEVDGDLPGGSGSSLTFLNHAHISRQVYQLSSERFGHLGHLTSLTPYFLGNAADPWESIALEAFESGETSFEGLQMIDGQEYFRYMRPLLVEKSCMPCHADQGYDVGETRGGISVSIPMEPLELMAREELQEANFAYLTFWVFGLVALYIVSRKIFENTLSMSNMRRDLDKNIKIHEVLNQITSSSVHVADMDQFYKNIWLAIHEVVPVSSFSIGLVDEEKQLIEFVYTVDTVSSEALDSIALNAPDSLSARVINEGKVLFKSGSELAKAVRDGEARLTGAMPHGWLGIPLMGNSKCHGLFMIQFYEATESIAQEDLDFLKEVALRLHLVIESWNKTRAIALNEKKLRAINDTANDAICMIDPMGNLTLINPAGLRMFGYLERDMIGKPIHDLIMPDEYKESQENAFKKFQNSGTGAAIGGTVELIAHKKSQERFPVEMSLSAVEMDDGWHAIAIIRDISQRSKVYATMEKLMAIIEQSDDAVLIADKSGVIEYVNPAFTSTTGYEPDEILKKNWLEPSQIDDFKIYEQAILEKINSNLPWKKRRKSRAKDGSNFDEETLISPIIDEKTSALKNIVITRRNISQEMQLEDQLHQAQKLESIGQLAAGIAHEINTPTQYVNDNIQFLSEAYGSIQKLLFSYEAVKLSDDDQGKIDQVKTDIDFEFTMSEVPAALEQSIEGIERVAKIVKAIKDFSHPGDKKMKLVDINRAIETTVTIARSEWKYVALINKELDKSLPLVGCLPGEINQVILNLVINAAHAIGSSLESTGREKGNITITTTQNSGKVVISIADDGTGIPENIQQRVFDPFFTTKKVGKGTGQGLSLAYMTIVNTHRGELYFHTEPGAGTTFYIELPIDGKIEEAHVV